MGLLQQSKVVFYHPLDNSTEWTQSEAWDGTAEYGPGKVDDALEAVVVAAGFGAETEFLSAEAVYIAAAALDATKFVVAYRHSAVNKGRARVGTVSGTDITFGAVGEFYSAGVQYISVSALDAATVVVGFTNDSSDDAVAVVGQVSGAEISFGSDKVANSGTCVWTAMAALSSTKFVIVYRDALDSGQGAAKVGTVAGTDITFGSEGEFASQYATYCHVAALDASKVVVTWRNADTGKGFAKVGEVSGTSIGFFGSEKEFSPGPGGVTESDLAALSSTKFVVVYEAASTDNGTARVGLVSGTDITFGAAAEYNANDSYWNSVAALGSDAFMVSYNDAADSQHGKVKVGTVTGTSVTFGAVTEFNAATTQYIDTVGFGSGKAVVCYRDVGDSDHGTAKAWQAGSSASSLAGESASYPAAAGETKVAFCGWFKKPSA